MRATRSSSSSRSSHWQAARALALVAIIASTSGRADSTPTTNGPQLVALAPSPDDARKAIAIGPRGEVYEPDGKGAWTRRARFTTADTLAYAGRAGGAVVAFGDGVVYKLARNGWSALRLHQKARSLMSEGDGAVAAVGRQLFALDRTVAGEPVKLATLPAAPIAIGSSATGVVVQTERGLVRVDGGKVTAIKNAPRRVAKLVSDRWALVRDGAIDLRTGRKTGLPPGVKIVAATVAPDQRLVMVASTRGALELVTVRQTKLERVPIAPPSTNGVTPTAANGSPTAANGSPPPASGTPSTRWPVSDVVAVTTDKAGRVVVAFADGTLVLRATPSGPWSVTRVTEQLPEPKPGPPPAVSR